MQNQEVKLEDILKSIRGVIDNHNNNLKTGEVIAKTDEEEIEEKEEQILELTSVFDPSKAVEAIAEDDKLISEESKLSSLSRINEFAREVKSKGYTYDKSETLIDSIALSIMKPLIKEWIDNNLSKMVEKVISEEIKQLIPKKN